MTTGDASLPDDGDGVHAHRHRRRTADVARGDPDAAGDQCRAISDPERRGTRDLVATTGRLRHVDYRNERRGLSELGPARHPAGRAATRSANPVLNRPARSEGRAGIQYGSGVKVR